ncbi:YbaB/EbfC family nucleoid-associated protein [Alicyclobacillus sp. SO9]|uniref:YbaB/EbfC family nucleoid-associated protein n=1 Tax=Alicyclobacillus sp. SO9 TaxID=2665646 RepID=UPI0018E7A769|nr:YbaB/EbfC family nucleoid-associated protein [Alicyclobacillus sp. SO9]QQE81094.1 YbaB/EbfC family nucleoid-associated protein [Alicyclobacillus sp. SO9]
MKNMNQIMKQAKKMQEDIARAQAELAEKTVEGTAGGGAVKTTMTGDKKLIGVSISKEVVDPEDIEMLQDLIVASFQDAMNQVDEMTSTELGKYTKGMNMPGLF